MKKRRLKVFEAFAGIGAQATALERIGIDYEIVGISDWFTDAIICYDAIHCKELLMQGELLKNLFKLLIVMNG